MATKTYENLITEARTLLQDTDSAGFRFSNQVLLDILNRALQTVARLRPDSCYNRFSTTDPYDLNVPEVVESGAVSGQTDWTTKFELDFMFYPPIVHYVVGMAEMTDDEYTEDGRAVALLSQFKTSVVSL